MPAPAKKPSGAAAPIRNIWVDADDLIEYGLHHARPSGIQRLSFELYRALVAEGAPTPRFCRHDRVTRTMREVQWSAIERLFEELTSRSTPPASTLPDVVPSRSAGRLRYYVSRLPADIRLPLGDAVRAQRTSVNAALRTLRGVRSAWRRRSAAKAERLKAAEATGGDLASLGGPDDILLALGSPWSRTDYADMVRDLQAATGMRFGLLVYDLIPLLRPEFCDQSNVRIFSAWFNSVLPLADSLFTISRSTAADVTAYAARHGLPLRSLPRPVPIGTGFAVAAAPVSPEQLPAGLTPGSYALAVSTVEARKNHVLLFRAWRHLLETRPPASVPKLVFAGRVAWMVSDLMQQIANTRNLDGHLVLVTEASDAELEALYRGCQFTLFPSLYEGWGLPVTESLNFGKPCLASDRASMPEAGGALARYADPENVGAWTDAIGRLIDDPRDLAAWEARIRREFVPVPWSATAAALRDALGQTVAAAAIDRVPAVASAPR